MTRLDAYLERIAWRGLLAIDLATLTALMRAHVPAIAFENIDVQLGRPPGLEAQAIFAKLVEQRRGGWCYEQNGLFGWALERIGFAVTRLSAGVMRHERGDETMGGHLALLVRLDRDYLVDVGFGGVLTRPLPLEPGEHDDAPFTVALARTDDGHWRYSEASDGAPTSFDFRAEPADEALLAERCGWQGSDPASPFVLNLVAQRRDGEVHRTLRGRVLTEVRAEGTRKTTIPDAAELVATLRDVFGLDVPEAADLWERISARHEGLQPPVVPTT